jgi:hypothetical protein
LSHHLSSSHSSSNILTHPCASTSLSLHLHSPLSYAWVKLHWPASSGVPHCAGLLGCGWAWDFFFLTGSVNYMYDVWLGRQSLASAALTTHRVAGRMVKAHEVTLITILGGRLSVAYAFGYSFSLFINGGLPRARCFTKDQVVHLEGYTKNSGCIEDTNSTNMIDMSCCTVLQIFPKIFSHTLHPLHFSLLFCHLTGFRS